MAIKDNKRRSVHPINERIRADKIQLITHEGTNIGVVSKSQALTMARDAGLDLVLISDRGDDEAPIAKIMDHGKALYEKKKKQAEAKKKQKVIQIKEVKIRPKIGEHDYQIKMNHAMQFLEEGKRVKFTLFFRGRELITKETRGNELFDKINKTLEDRGLLKQLIREKDSKSRQTWSRVYYKK